MGKVLLQGLLGVGEKIAIVDLPVVIDRLKTDNPHERVSFFSDYQKALTTFPEADIVLAVKPYQVANIMPAIKDRNLILSIVAGQDLQYYHSLTKKWNVVRVMTNVSAHLQAAPIVLCGKREEQPEALMQRASQLFSSLGEVIVLEDEKQFNIVTAILGSGPALALEAVEGLALGGVRHGLPRDVSLKLGAYALLGAAQLVLKEAKSPTALRDQICTPGGCTIAGVESLERDAFRGSLMKAIGGILDALKPPQ